MTCGCGGVTIRTPHDWCVMVVVTPQSLGKSLKSGLMTTKEAWDRRAVIYVSLEALTLPSGGTIALHHGHLCEGNTHYHNPESKLKFYSQLYNMYIEIYWPLAVGRTA